MMPDVAARCSAVIGAGPQPLQLPQIIHKPWQWLFEKWFEIGRCDQQKVANRPVLDSEASIHISLAHGHGRVERDARREVAVTQAYRQMRPACAVAEVRGTAVGIDDGQPSVTNQVGKHPTQNRQPRGTSCFPVHRYNLAAGKRGSIPDAGTPLVRSSTAPRRVDAKSAAICTTEPCWVCRGLAPSPKLWLECIMPSDRLFISSNIKLIVWKLISNDLDAEYVDSLSGHEIMRHPKGGAAMMPIRRDRRGCGFTSRAPGRRQTAGRSVLFAAAAEGREKCRTDAEDDREHCREAFARHQRQPGEQEDGAGQQDR